MEALQTENVFMKQIPVEGLKVSDIKNDAMPLRNRTVVDGLGLHDVEKGVTSAPGIGDPLEQHAINGGLSLGSEHSGLLCIEWTKTTKRHL